MACVSTDLDCALSYALQRLGTPNLILKPEQRSVIESICNGKDTFVWLPTGFGKLICYQTLPFIFDKMQRCSCCSAWTDTKGRQTLRYVRTDLLSWGRTRAHLVSVDHLCPQDVTAKYFTIWKYVYCIVLLLLYLSALHGASYRMNEWKWMRT